MRESWRVVLAVSVVTFLFVGVAGTYALVRSPKSETPGSATEPPRLETARLFSPRGAAPARDEIAATLAHEAAPAVWPQPKLPKHAKVDTFKPDQKSTEAVRRVPQNHKQPKVKPMPG
jgi:hypothetical protein